ncbi:MAG: ABC transporter substrate-binding protein [Candidatus Eremiobacteraeota bacterium]|nr:ABC transporter substrate-binding protein [Candidatus Eremiobacteraeota bacterium]MBV8645178.1 ABC transporter substrate-binding protein [Candidatus Eremiobacteraeota bacterium]
MRTALLAASLALVALAPARAADETATIRVGATGNDTAAEVYYAQDLGLFAKRKLDVTVENLRNGAAEAAAVAGGALDVGEQNVVSMANAHVHGLPIVFVAPAGEYVAAAPTTSLLVGKNSPIRSARDLNGKTVAVNALNDLTQIGASAWIDAHGGDASKVRFIEMPPAQIGAALGRGTVDAGVVPEPSLTLAAGETRILGQPYDALAARFTINGWFANRDWVAKNPSVAKRFADAVAEAGRWANAHHAESAAIFARHSSADPAVIARMRRATYGERFDLHALQAVIDAAARYKVLAHSFPAPEVLDARL